MIFATVGSHPTFAFDRFLRALEQFPPGELVVQHGPGTPPTNAAEAVPWMRFPKMLEHMQEADKVVSHAGTGSILLATRAGHRPLIVPRLRRYGETVDDHQLDLARTLAETGRIVLIEDVETIVESAAGAPRRGGASTAKTSLLIESVHGELQHSVRGDGSRTPSR